MLKLSSNVFFDALTFQNRDRPPVWLMRQAGRYMPQYQKLRKKYSLEEMFHNKGLIADVTLLPVNHIGVDAAILFSDILLILEAIGCSVTYEGGISVKIGDSPFDPAPLKPALEAIRLLKRELKVPLIGFAGGPYTVATYLKCPITPELLQKITDATRLYLEMQIDAGVDVIQIFDSWAGTLPPEVFEEMSLKYLKQLVPLEVPTLLFTRGSCRYAEALNGLGATGISLDSEKSPEEIRWRLPNTVLQGNLDPEILKMPKAIIKSYVGVMMKRMRRDRGYIVNLGHGVLPDTPYENVKYFVHLVQDIFAKDYLLT
ncbi:MAG: uroporphyrinogen decarboxylase [Simkaniaceae bacterium]|nr:uroporphyrinogen decarboxylase [Simkaniaceae bacterium]